VNVKLQPWPSWSAVAVQVPRTAVLNKFGGWKFTTDGIDVDVWPDTLDRLATYPFFRYAWHMRSNTLIRRENLT
jgi:hypothetical protein